MNIFQGTKIIIIITVLILSSCATPSKVDCPSFDSGKVAKSKNYKSRVNNFNVRKTFALKDRYNFKREKLTNSNPVNDQIEDLNVLEHDLFVQNEIEDSINIETLEAAYTFEQKGDEAYGNIGINHIKIQKHNIYTRRNMNNIKTSSKIPKDVIYYPVKKIKDINKNKTERKTAKVIGGALLLMAVLAGIAIPALGSLTASLGLVGIFILDILVSFGIYKYHKKEKPKLAKVSSILRFLYTAILGVAIGYHIMGNVPIFNSIWGIGLIAFGIHLITLGILFNNEGGKKWVNIFIKSLLIIAGIGYVIQYIGILIVPNPIGFAALIESLFIIPMILGEVFFALWMLIKGGKLRKLEIKNS